jgi:hypothetical protein
MRRRREAFFPSCFTFLASKLFHPPQRSSDDEAADGGGGSSTGGGDAAPFSDVDVDMDAGTSEVVARAKVVSGTERVAGRPDAVAALEATLHAAVVFILPFVSEVSVASATTELLGMDEQLRSEWLAAQQLQCRYVVDGEDAAIVSPPAQRMWCVGYLLRVLHAALPLPDDALLAVARRVVVLVLLSGVGPDDVLCAAWQSHRLEQKHAASAAAKSSAGSAAGVEDSADSPAGIAWTLDTVSAFAVAMFLPLGSSAALAHVVLPSVVLPLHWLHLTMHCVSCLLAPAGSGRGMSMLVGRRAVSLLSTVCAGVTDNAVVDTTLGADAPEVHLVLRVFDFILTCPDSSQRQFAYRVVDQYILTFAPRSRYVPCVAPSSRCRRVTAVALVACGAGGGYFDMCCALHSTSSSLPLCWTVCAKRSPRQRGRRAPSRSPTCSRHCSRCWRTSLTLAPQRSCSTRSCTSAC